MRESRAEEHHVRLRGFDAGTGRYVELFDVGVIDPTKVVRVALQNAVSVASVLLLAEATMTEIPEGPAAHEEPSGMHGMEWTLRDERTVPASP